MRNLFHLACFIGLLCLIRPGDAAARTQEALRYRPEHVWNAAVRLIRVEMGLAIEERDEDAGFFLFRYVDHDTPYPGSFELVRKREGGRQVASVIVHVGDMPRYVERMILDKLAKKLEQEYGPPMAPRPPAKRQPEQSPEDDAPEQPSEGDPKG